jgi:hypothetical protein
LPWFITTPTETHHAIRHHGKTILYQWISASEVRSKLALRYGERQQNQDHADGQTQFRSRLQDAEVVHWIFEPECDR